MGDASHVTRGSFFSRHRMTTPRPFLMIRLRPLVAVPSNHTCICRGAAARFTTINEGTMKAMRMLAVGLVVCLSGVMSRAEERRGRAKLLVGVWETTKADEGTLP